MQSLSSQSLLIMGVGMLILALNLDNTTVKICALIVSIALNIWAVVKNIRETKSK